MKKAFNNNGFTVIELMISVVIMAVIVAIGLPTFISSFPKKRVNGAARNLVFDMQWARTRAVNENTNNYYITFDTVNHTYTVFLDTVVTNGTLDAGEEIRTVDIDSEYTDIQFGYVAANEPLTNPGAAITTSVDCTTINFTSKGISGCSGYIYLKPSQDTIGENVRAIQVTRAGSFRVYTYLTGSSTWN